MSKDKDNDGLTIWTHSLCKMLNIIWKWIKQEVQVLIVKINKHNSPKMHYKLLFSVSDLKYTSKMTKYFFVRTFCIDSIYTNAHSSHFSMCLRDFLLWNIETSSCHKKCNFPSSHLAFYRTKNILHNVTSQRWCTAQVFLIMAEERSSSF